MPLAAREWGRTDYPDALVRMRSLRAERRAGTVPDTLILTEHEPVITVGVGGADPATLPEGLPVVPVERGGQATYHGPGQLVGYAIVDLAERGHDVRRFVHDLEEVVARAVGEVGVEASRVPGKRGVWVDGRRKIASVGVAVEEWVTFHGFALNVDVDLAEFARFEPCGLPGSVMTSVAREVGHPVSLSELQGPVLAGWAAVFGAPYVRTAPPTIAPPSPA
ncbi:MAG TPA: lipoyl(octanoyl) transferase LipB [Thermoplasmata archaeon]|nr:lipoyl(octanoyl) transferase LipB [Thermoplasmata archaeon]